MAFTNGHALVIGVGTHKYGAARDEELTVSDAQEVWNVLTSAKFCGYPEEQAKLLTNGDASKNVIVKELEKLAQTVSQEDTVFVFFCGHGKQGTDGNYHLVSHDARVQGDRIVPGTALSAAELVDNLRKIKAERLLLIVNACLSGGIAPTLGDEENLSSDTASALLGTGKGRIVITACGEDQASYVGDGALTIFGQVLVDGLRGRGVRNNRGFISAFSLYEYVHETVKERVDEDLKRRQEPVINVIKGVGPFAIALYKGASSLGEFDASETLSSGDSVRAVRREHSVRQMQLVLQNGGVNFGTGNTVSISGDVVGGDKVTTKIDARNSQGFIVGNSGNVTQNYGSSIDTGGGAYIGGNVNAGGDFVGRDKVVNNAYGNRGTEGV